MAQEQGECMKSIGMKMMRQDSNETESFRAKGRRKISRDEYISVHPDDSDEDSSAGGENVAMEDEPVAAKDKDDSKKDEGRRK